MIIVLDTNVLVSGLLSPFGPPARVVDQVVSTTVQVAFDDRIMAEYSEVLQRPKFSFDPADVKALIEHIELVGIHVSAAPLNPNRLPDASDLPFAEVAVTAGVDVLVTGNKDHFEFLEDHNVPVVSPSEFLEIIGRLSEE